MYAVVTLEDSNELMLAASNWLTLDKTQCYWPSFRSAEKCSEAVENRLEPLTPGVPWDIIKINCHEEYETYDQAQRGLQKIKSLTQVLKRPKLENLREMFQYPPSDPSPTASRLSTNTTDKDEILKMLKEIKSKVDENSTMLKKLVKDAPVSEGAPSSTSTQSKDNPLNLNLPLRTFEDLERTEQELKKAGQRKKYVKYLSEVGGFGAKAVTKNIIQKVLTEDLAKEFSWQGRGEKRPFSRLALADVIKEAASKHKITEKECETEIKKQLSYIADRICRKKPRDTGPGAVNQGRFSFSTSKFEFSLMKDSEDM